jgi:3-isopropylmalate/(R)-2-methylmalate dehydratase small subunit
MSPEASARRRVVGRGIPLPGNDIDTDRIIPARHLKSVTFEGLGEHAFADERKAVPEHPFNRPQFQGASILVVGQNFGCGSSREHAPHALRLWGIQAIVGGSYGEIFFGNCTALGIPCVTAAAEDLGWLMAEVERYPDREVTLDVEAREARVGDRVFPIAMPEGVHRQLVSGTWSAMGVLLEAGDAIERTARVLPYVAGF